MDGADAELQEVIELGIFDEEELSKIQAGKALSTFELEGELLKRGKGMTKSSFHILRRLDALT